MRGVAFRAMVRSLLLTMSGFCLASSGVGAAFAGDAFPPSPYEILASRDLETPLLDAVSYCVPKGVDAAVDPILEHATAGEWEEARGLLTNWSDGLVRPGLELEVLDAVLQARAAGDRAEWMDIESRMTQMLLRPEVEPLTLCLRLELARVLLLMSRESEAAAQLVRAERWLDGHESDARHADEVAFFRAELLYRIGRAFDAHLSYRELTQSTSERLALAARLRLTDLSFDSGRVDGVSDEYEALLPRASAIGASTTGWGLRAAEAALDAGEPDRAQRWLERFYDTTRDRDARDSMEIRLADLDVALEDPIPARKRLSGVSGRRVGDPIGALAAVRAIDLGVSRGSDEQRLEILLHALRDQREGVRRYALGVTMDELERRGDLDGALAVATRLAYEGVDTVVTPGFEEALDALLRAVAAQREGGGGCRQLVRALGGRYGVLIERASEPTAFTRLGECFEEMELPWLAVTLYRSISRRFGPEGARQVALSLARTSLTIGEGALARGASTAALESPDADVESWRAILAEVDFLDGRYEEAAEGLRRVIDLPVLARERGRLLRMLALCLEHQSGIEDADFISARVPVWLDEGGGGPKARAAMVETALLAGHAYRRSGRPDRAEALYRVVDSHAGEGALRSSARFWLGFAGARDGAGELAWGEDPEEALGSPWSRYALFERRFERLESAYGEGRR